VAASRARSDRLARVDLPAKADPKAAGAIAHLIHAAAKALPVRTRRSALRWNRRSRRLILI